MIINLNNNISDIIYSGYTISKAYACGGSLVYEKEEPTPPPYSGQYLTFVALEDGTFRYTTVGLNRVNYSLDNGATWTELAPNTDTPTITAGSKILLSSYGAVGTFSSTNRFNVEGNIMSLLYGDEFEGKTSLEGYAEIFENLFDSGKVVNAKSLILPATTLSRYCYRGMFEGCTSLTEAPELPATTLAEWCYYEMFNGCTSLTTAPELPATTLTDGCYASMFYRCTSLMEAPELPATTLARNCYNGMFYGCRSLTTAPSVLPATTLTDNCYSGMFNGCKSLTTAPELPATTLTDYCYNGMFNSCSSLNYIKCLATDNSAGFCTNQWVLLVAANGTFVKAAAMNNWESGRDGIPQGWTVENA